MTDEPSWDLYRTFAAVLREGSLSGAARSLGLTQPSVGRHIDALEMVVGADLFVRSQRGLSPTDRALAIKPYAELLASAAAALLRTASGDDGTVEGTVRITASEIVGTELLPPILALLRQSHPLLDIELVVTNAVEDLLRRQSDIAVRMVEPRQQALVARRIGVATLGLHANVAYLERRGVPRTLEDLRRYDVIGTDTETPAARRLARLPRVGSRERGIAHRQRRRTARHPSWRRDRRLPCGDRAAGSSSRLRPPGGVLV